MRLHYPRSRSSALTSRPRPPLTTRGHGNFSEQINIALVAVYRTRMELHPLACMQARRHAEHHVKQWPLVSSTSTAMTQQLPTEHSIRVPHLHPVRRPLPLVMATVDSSSRGSGGAPCLKQFQRLQGSSVFAAAPEAAGPISMPDPVPSTGYLCLCILQMRWSLFNGQLGPVALGPGPRANFRAQL